MLTPKDAILTRAKFSKKRVAILLEIIFLAMICGFAAWFSVARHQTSLINASALSKLAVKSDSSINTSHLAKGLTPPTNKWFSGLALQKNPQTVFPSPLSVSASNNSFSYGLPIIVATANAVTGDTAETVKVQVAGAITYKVTSYDQLSVVLTYINARHQEVGTLTLMAGSPYLQFYSQRPVQLAITSLLGEPKINDNSASLTAVNGTYVIAGFRGTSLAATTSVLHIALPKAGLITAYVAPTASAETILNRYADIRVLGGDVSYQKVNNNYKTTFDIKTDNNQPTLYALLPHQTNTAKPLFTYNTLYGDQRVYVVKNISFTTPAVKVSSALNLKNMSSYDKSLLLSTLGKDIASTSYTADDSYFGGKQLYRSAQLLQLAEQLGDKAGSKSIESKLQNALSEWLTNTDTASDHYFYYDPQLKSIVGYQPSYGSQDDNDHDFHYGYFIYAAAILAKYDHSFLIKCQADVNLLVADIANYQSGQALPLRRNFDPYFGHSWASGFAPSDDGNDQESSSEAINAWIATSLWAEQTHNTTLGQEAGWMLSNEVAASRDYWLDINTSKAPFNNIYNHSLVSLNWGGKRVYGTFFSNEPMAMLGIQLIPMSPTEIKAVSNSPDLAKQISEAVQGTYDEPLGDYVLMYNTNMPASQRLAIAKSMPSSEIDSADSRAYLYAVILSEQ